MTEKRIRVFLVDDHKIFAKGVASLLSSEKTIEVKGFAFSGQEALKFLEENQDTVDLVITDIQMPEMSGIELTRLIKDQFPEIKVIGLSMLDKAEVIRELITAGAEGYLLKDIEKSELLLAIDDVINNKIYYSGSIAKALILTIENKDLLTKREKEIIRLIAEEYTNAMIAGKLFISEYTVESHRKNIFRKTKAKSIVGLVNYAHENKLL